MSASKGKVRIPPSALTWRFSRSSGPGGQHVNTSDTRVELICDLTQISGTPSVIERITNRFGSELRIVASSERSQARNRQLAMQKLVERLEKTAKAPKSRRATKPTWGSVQDRLSEKKKASERKAARRTPPPD